MKRFRPYFSFLRPVQRQFFLAILAGMVAAAASGFGLPFMLEKIFPLIFSGDPEKTAASKEGFVFLFNALGLEMPQGNALLIFACLLLPLVFAVRGVAGFVNTYWVNFCGLKVLEALRVQLFDRFQHLSLRFHQQQSEGDLLSRVLTDTNMLQTVLVRVACDLIVQPFLLIAAFSYLIYASVKDSASFFMLVALLTVPVCVLPIRFIGKKLVKKARSMQRKLGDMTAMVAENLASQREIRAYNLQESELDQFKKETGSFLRFRLKVVKYNYLISPLVEFIAALGVALSIFLGVQQGMTLEKFLPLVTALYMAYDPVKKLGKVHGEMRKGEAALDRIEEVLLAEDEVSNGKQSVQPELFTGSVQFSKVHFSYADEPILSNFNLTIPAGQTVALVGPTGAGKSSFISLIPRFYEIDSGEISFDGVSIDCLDKYFLRDQIALVSQKPLLFRGSLRENILIGRPDASEEEMMQAARRAQAHDFIMQLPGGYNYSVGERGEGLSGGQCQRIAIARAFLKQAPILILDEGTSALDAETELKIQQELARSSAGQTTFLIAHRFSSIRHADRILVFQNRGKGGEIIADGSHAELIKSCALYRELAGHQL